MNRINDNTEQTAKLMMSDLLNPIRFITQPDKKPPVKPPIPINIMLKPPSFRALVVDRLCIQVGNHEKMAQSPISMVPKMREPTRSALMFPVWSK